MEDSGATNPNITVVDEETLVNGVSSVDGQKASANTVEENIYNVVGDTPDIRNINLPRSEVGCCKNSRGQNLHFRLTFKQHEPIHSVIVYLHGYAGHINRPTYPYFIDECLKENVALLCLDFHGHGYSEGTMAYVEEQDHLLDDVTCLLRYVYHKDFNSHECSFNEHVSGHNNHEKEKQKKKDDPHVMTSEHEEYEHFNLIEKQVPFYLMGQSMGGAVAIRLGNYYNTLKKNVANGENIDEDAEVEVSCSGVSGSNASGDNTTTSSWFSLNFNNNPGYKKPIDKSYASCFKGVVLLAPAVSNKLPPPVVRMVFENILVPLFPSSSIPKSLSGAVDDHSTLWNSEKYIEYIAVKDKHHPISNPHALSFGDSIRFKTANTIVQMMEKVQTEIEHIDFPFIIFHDPEDKVILYKGSLMLLNNSKTSNSQKHLYALPNAKHDLFSNRLSLIVKLTLDWIKKL